MVKKKKKAGRPKADKPATRGRGLSRAYPVQLRLHAVKAVVEEGAPAPRVARMFGVSVSALKGWVSRYEKLGFEGLLPQPVGGASVAQQASSDAKKQAVVSAKQAAPQHGTRRIRDILARFEGLGVSDSTVRRILHEEGLLEPQAAARSRAPKPPRRFERAQPNQLWQSDIFTFLLRRHERLYLTVFMDDHSRFIVGHAVAHQQKSVLVMEALDRGIAAYGAPREVLTDNGRQYTAWRGKTAFEQELKRQGIEHIKSRPQHPRRWARWSVSGRRCGTSFCRGRCLPTSPTASGGCTSTSTATISSAPIRVSRGWYLPTAFSRPLHRCGMRSSEMSVQTPCGSPPKSPSASPSTWSAAWATGTCPSLPQGATCGCSLANKTPKPFTCPRSRPMSNSPQRASAEKPTKKKKATRKKRSRPTPRLLTQDNDLDELAKRRTLMILSVLSGQVTVTDAIESAKISRPRYYQLEIQAIQGMMRELGSDGGLDTQYRQAQRTIEELQGQLQKLQTDKQRLEHLLTVTRKVVKSGPMTLSKRRPKKARAARSGSSVSTSSQEEVTSTEASSSPTSTAER